MVRHVTGLVRLFSAPDGSPLEFLKCVITPEASVV
jgi:hypothetical protein